MPAWGEVGLRVRLGANKSVWVRVFHVGRNPSNLYLSPTMASQCTPAGGCPQDPEQGRGPRHSDGGPVPELPVIWVMLDVWVWGRLQELI